MLGAHRCVLMLVVLSSEPNTFHTGGRVLLSNLYTVGRTLEMKNGSEKGVIDKFIFDPGVYLQNFPELSCKIL